ncbi:ADP-ribosyltransferase (plasmid) [Bacillus shihchuchen]|uniref:ADP-ribosyltransferase n=1 Tax=Bacillus shihchuchen TaxID=3036942 RepID=A0ABT7L040_9BACI|nr:ADP-ribosyltransferase [Bacillus shihchuchen]
MGAKNYGDWYTQLNPLQQTEITGYLQQDYRSINPYIRNENPEKFIDKKLGEKVNNIQQPLSIKSLPEDLVVYRRMGATECNLTVADPAYNFNDPKNVAAFKEQWDGQEKEQLGFFSTTILKNGAVQMAPRKLILRLQVPKGTHAAYINFTDA